MDIDAYNQIRSGAIGFIELPRGLIAVWGKEAVQFLDGLITNDMKTLEDGQQMLAAFPNAQGRLLAVVRVLRQGDRFLFETEEATREKLFNSLFRFTYAGDFFVEDISNHFHFTRMFGDLPSDIARYEKPSIGKKGQIEYRGIHFDVISSLRGEHVDILIPSTQIQEDFIEDAIDAGAIFTNNFLADFFEVFRIENGIPLYDVDMDENTIVPELGIDGLISYNKGCYIGQEIIARIHFRGHIAKQLTGLVFQDADKGVRVPADLTTADGKNAGRITSVTYSPKLEKSIALGYVRYDFLGPGTMLRSGEMNLEVASLPFL